ncbi:DUF4344 domain-containing metallopeptidase [Mycolicibacterium obuense]|uniref:Uncharacterized protein n=1 Tax=Mycolicibacterium obuense TaxID=1807 RepID=A0A0J6VI92_9MYCO|nr:DUF4344 domain-containing metallopeptidase [Mycolicibacterium obuense]KMO69173.1 hypothetical protein MOBUDSM44075_04597 [Mycolicibacterium obuense]
MRVWGIVVLTVGLVAGCSSSPAPSPSSAPPAAKASGAPQDPQANGEAEGAEGAPGDGTMIVTYEDATTPDAAAGRALLQDNTVLDDLAADINESLYLPHDITLRGAQCDEPNAFWDAGADSITLCYEDADSAKKVFTALGDPDPTAAAVNSEYATFYHEVGHMAISIYDLPITGREEDVADQLAAFVLLQPGDDGKPDPESVKAVKDFASTFEASGAEREQLGAADFADVHSLDETRMFNLQCWIYGADPEAGADLVTSGQLPEGRADGCADEWNQLDNAWSTLLDPHLK